MYPVGTNCAPLVAYLFLCCYERDFMNLFGMPMGTNCAPLVADLFLYCYKRDLMNPLNHDNQADVIEA